MLVSIFMTAMRVFRVFNFGLFLNRLKRKNINIIGGSGLFSQYKSNVQTFISFFSFIESRGISNLLYR